MDDETAPRLLASWCTAAGTRSGESGKSPGEISKHILSALMADSPVASCLLDPEIWQEGEPWRAPQVPSIPPAQVPRGEELGSLGSCSSRRLCSPQFCPGCIAYL